MAELNFWQGAATPNFPRDVILRNLVTGLLVHHLASTGPTPGSDELPERYQGLIDDLTELMIDEVNNAADHA